MKNKYILSIFILGMIIVFTGAMSKINHIRFMEMEIAQILLFKGMLLQVIAGILVIWKLIRNKQPDNFWNK